MALTAAEQFMLELINRARLDPAAEAARLGIGLNDNLAPGQLGIQARQALAPNALLEAAAIGHSQWMLAADVFSHTGKGGSSPGDRAKAATYNWNSYGENISWIGTTGKIDLNASIQAQHDSLFKSASHRVNFLNDGFREVGIAQEQGVFTQGRNFNTSMVTELFGRAGTKVFLTGVAYSDTNKDGFYSIGEGKGGVYFAAQGMWASTENAGGYSLALNANASVAVSGTVGTLNFTATVVMSIGNVKLDVVDGNTLLSSGSLTLGTGINNARLLGIGALDATGNAAANKLTGNNGANTLTGLAGNDDLRGAGGNDRLLGGTGLDSLFGDAGNDMLYGGDEDDSLSGGSGADRLYGDIGRDQLAGGADADTFVFTSGGGADVITDFTRSQNDMIWLDDAIWGGAVKTEAQVVAQYARVVSGSVVFDFGNGNTISLTGVITLTGSADQIDII